MKVGTRISFAIVLALAATLARPAPVSAQFDAAKLPAAKQAAATFADRAKGSEKSGQVPRLSDPEAKKLLDVIFDTGDITAAKTTIPFDQLGALSDRMLIGNQVGTIYMLSGTGFTDLGQVGKDDYGKVNLNVVKHPEEMGRYIDFTVTMEAAMADVVQGYLTTAKPADINKPAFQGGVGKIRSGVTKSLKGTLETLAIIGLTDDWVRARLLVIAATAPKLKAFLSPEQKEELRKMAVAVADVTDDFPAKKALQDFARAIAGG